MSNPLNLKNGRFKVILQTDLPYKDKKKWELFECQRNSAELQVPVQVQGMDRYGHFGGVFACMGPVDGPVRALG